MDKQIHLTNTPALHFLSSFRNAKDMIKGTRAKFLYIMIPDEKSGAPFCKSHLIEAIETVYIF